MKIVSLFSGAGGLDLGLIQAGHKVVWANDFDRDAVETYRNNIGTHIVCAPIEEVPPLLGLAIGNMLSRAVGAIKKAPKKKIKEAA